MPTVRHATTYSQLADSFADQLGATESRLRAAAACSNPALAGITRHLIDAGGKRLRPILVLAAAGCVPGAPSSSVRVIEAAACVEFLHLASLYHDDVLDAAAVRRGLPSVNELWGNHRAVLGGDTLLTHAFRIAARLGARETLRLSDTLSELCAGQISESESVFDRTRDPEQYQAAVRGKTAALLATSCWFGALEAGAPAAVLEALSGFGTELGVAFQLADDIIDLCAPAELTGKPPGNDVLQGVFTLPVLIALRDDPALADLLVPGIDAMGIAEVRRRVEATGAHHRALRTALSHLHAAMTHLCACELATEGVHALRAVAAAVLGPLRACGLLDGDPLGLAAIETTA